MTEFANPARRERYFAALANPQFRLLFVARTTSLFGDAFAPIALAFAVLEIGGSASDLGLVLAATTLPRAAFMLFGGVVGDRLRRDRLLVATDAVQALAQSVVGVLLVTGHASVLEIAAVQAVRGTASAFFYPAATGLLPQLVPRGMLQQANALLGISTSTTAILGAAAGGAIVASFGAGTALLVDAATFAASGLLVLRLRLPPAARTVVPPGLWHDLVEGWREFTSRAWLWKTVVYFALFNAAVLAPYLVLGPLVAKTSLEGAAAWAAIVTAAAAGGLLGTWIALRVRPQRPLRAGFVAVLGMAPVFALLAVAAPTAVVTVAAAFWGFRPPVLLCAVGNGAPGACSGGNALACRVLRLACDIDVRAARLDARWTDCSDVLRLGDLVGLGGGPHRRDPRDARDARRACGRATLR
jgi:MFS family permease